MLTNKCTLKWFFLVSSLLLVELLSAENEDLHVFPSEKRTIEEHGEGRNLLDWIGLGTGPDLDPYMAKTNSDCLNGDLAECFKSRALQSLDEFFNKEIYPLTENARIVRMPKSHIGDLSQERYEFSDTPRTNDSEWEQLVKFLLRKVERFMKSAAIEVKFNDEVTERGRYSPRFVDEIVDEIGVIEDKKDSYFKRKQLKKLFIPMLIILKLFKLKLLLFLPLILGLASFKKFLGLMAIAIPGIIGLLKLCKPNLQSPFSQGGYAPPYSSGGIGFQSQHGGGEHSYYNQDNGILFRDQPHHDLPYSGYSHYRNSGKDITSDETSKKSILPDS